MNEILITVPGKPIAKARPRFARRGKFVTTYNDQQTEEGKFIQIMMAQLSGHVPIPADTPITLEMAFHMPYPASMSIKKRKDAYHTKKPDLDNMIKFFKDCANGILWHDDSQVMGIKAGKIYAEDPKTIAVIRW